MLAVATKALIRDALTNDFWINRATVCHIGWTTASAATKSSNSERGSQADRLWPG
jgi:hypothetical protein